MFKLTCSCDYCEEERKKEGQGRLVYIENRPESMTFPDVDRHFRAASFIPMKSNGESWTAKYQTDPSERYVGMKPTHAAPYGMMESELGTATELFQREQAYKSPPLTLAELSKAWTPKKYPFEGSKIIIPKRDAKTYKDQYEGNFKEPTYPGKNLLIQEHNMAYTSDTQAASNVGTAAPGTMMSHCAKHGFYPATVGCFHCMYPVTLNPLPTQVDMSPTPAPTNIQTLAHHNDWTICRERPVDDKPVLRTKDDSTLLAFDSQGNTIRSKECKLVLDGYAFLWQNNKLFSGKIEHEETIDQKRVRIETEKVQAAQAKIAKHNEKIKKQQQALLNKANQLSEKLKY